MKELTKEQKEELKRLADEIMNLATEVVQDYEENPSEVSGSTIQIHEDSPFMSDNKILEGDNWKHTIMGNPILDKVSSEKADESAQENQNSLEDQATKDRKRWSG